MTENLRQTDEANTLKRARILGLQYIDTSSIANKQINKDFLTNEELYKLRIVPVIFDAHNITFGITNTTSPRTLVDIRNRFPDFNVTFALISDQGYQDYMQLYDPPKQVVYHNIEINKTNAAEQVNSISSILEQVKADDILAYLVEQAHRLNASDIHIETQLSSARVRYRIDGVLHPVAELTIEKYRTLIQSIASAGNISTSSNEAQQGHISQRVKMANNEVVNINIRLESTPTINGMDVVMRLFNMDSKMFTLDRLGLTPEERAVVDDIIKKPSGLVLVVGPTGSGKTTTLYSILNTLSNPERKIITIEDPVEFQFPGVTQISVTSSTGEQSNFANGLRAVLRLDPDIVMVGEIRDNDTAKTALQAALTGHLVLSTFHAASASAALTRLLDIIGENPLFISSIRLVMAQRLIRRLDDTLKTPFKPDELQMAKIKEVVDSLPPDVTKPNLDNLQIYQEGHSPQNPYGFTGQLAIREQFLMSGEILKLLQTTKVSTTQQIEQAAINSGMLTMLQDGILKVIAGETTFSEVFRVVD
jgi:type II secretory ATPase GspE/PulE/Tfp pilus assembly ATPase PilB-like protein